MEPWDDRGQSIQIGAVLIFAALILLLSLYQATIVPQQNEQVEFDHSQQVQGDLLDLRNAVTSMVGESASRSVSIQLGTTYPSRVLAVNPPPVSGLLRTAGTADGDVNFTLSNVEALDDETDDFWRGPVDPYSTGAVVYRPSYNEYGQPPQTVYDSTVLYDHFTFEEATITRSDQTLIDGSTISLVALNGSLQRSSSGAASVDVRPKSASSTTIAVSNRTGGNISIEFSTRLSQTTWEDMLEDSDQFVRQGGNVTSVQPVSSGPGEFETLAINLTSGTYELRMAKAGVGTRVNGTSAAYMTDVAADGSTVPEDGSVRLTLEVRDAYNNPVAGVNVTGESQETANGTLNRTEVATDDDGRAMFQFEASSVNASADVPVHFNFTLPDESPTPFNPRDPEDIEVTVAVQNTQVPEGSGGGGGAGYSLAWTDAGTVPGPTTGTSSEVCGSGSNLNPCSVVLQSETTDAQIGAPVGFGSNDTSLVQVLDRIDATTSDGTARTTVRFERAEGNATLWTQSAGANATRIVSTPSYSSFDTGFGEWGAFGNFQEGAPFRTGVEGSNSGQAVVLPGGDDGGIITTGYNTSGAELVVFQYWIENSDTGDPDDSGGDISVEYRDSSRNWIEVDSLVQTSGNIQEELRTVRLGSGAIHGNLSLRFRQTGADNANDEWVIDDPQISVIGEAVGSGGPGGGGNQPPSASFTVSDSNPDVGQTVTFDASGPSGSNDPDGSIVSYSWDFGDGTPGSGETTTHTYGSSGTYTVTLTVTDDDGATDTATQQVTVSAPGGFQRTSATALLPDTGQQRQTFTFTPDTEIPSGTQVEITLDDPQQQSPLQVDYQGGPNANVSLSNSNSGTNGDTAFITITPSSNVAAGETVAVWTDTVTTGGDGQYDVTVTRGDTGVSTTAAFEVGRNVGDAEIRNFEATDLQADTSSQQQTFTFTLDSDLAGGERINLGLTPAEGGSDVSYQGLGSVNVSASNTNFNKNAGRVWVLIEAPSGGLSAGTGVEVVVNADTGQLSGAPYEVGITRGDAGTTSTTFGVSELASLPTLSTRVDDLSDDARDTVRLIGSYNVSNTNSSFERVDVSFTHPTDSSASQTFTQSVTKAGVQFTNGYGTETTYDITFDVIYTVNGNERVVTSQTLSDTPDGSNPSGNSDLAGSGSAQFTAADIEDRSTNSDGPRYRFDYGVGSGSFSEVALGMLSINDNNGATEVVTGLSTSDDRLLAPGGGGFNTEYRSVIVVRDANGAVVDTYEIIDVADGTAPGNDPSAISITTLQGFQANPGGGNFTLDQIQIQDAKSPDNLDKVEYEIIDSTGAVVATRSDSAIPADQYQPTSSSPVSITPNSR
jgi:hypothetical protein